MKPDIEYLLTNCFTGKSKDVIYARIGTTFMDKRCLIDIKYANRISGFINFEGVKNDMIKKSFERNFKIENLNNPILIDFLIAEFSKTAHFDFQYKKWEGLINGSWDLHYNGVYSGSFSFDNVVGVRTYEFLPYVLTEQMLYRTNFEEGKKKLSSLGIKFFNSGGSVADYIQRNLVEFKPLFSDTVDYLESLK